MDREVSLVMSTNSFRAPWYRPQCSRPLQAVPAVAHPEPLPAARGHLPVAIKLPGRFMVDRGTVERRGRRRQVTHPVQSCLAKHEIECILVFSWVL